MGKKKLTKIADYLYSLVRYLFTYRKIPGIVCNVSPFNSQYNAMANESFRMERMGATAEQLEEFLRDYNITTTEGQWGVPDRFPTNEENLEINEEILGVN